MKNQQENCIKCKVCQVETDQRIRCGALVCEACKRFFMRRRRLDNSGLSCRNGNDQCLKQAKIQSRLTQRGWIWRDLCAACRYQKCLQVGMGRASSVPANTEAAPSPSVGGDSVFDNSLVGPRAFPTTTFDYQRLFEICEQMKREKENEYLQHQQQQQQQQQNIAWLSNNFSSIISDYLNAITTTTQQ